MKIDANGFGRGAVFIFEGVVIQTAISRMTRGDGLNLRPND
jgi:hypothetical protein